MSALKFILQYITKPRTVGAILPSSKYLAKKMIAQVDFDKASCIVEYGPGTGVFTDEILGRRKPDTRLILLERNPEFADQLTKKYENTKNVIVINDTAEQIGKYLNMYSIPKADAIISGLPFASLPKETSENILKETKKHLCDGGKFITFQYTLLRKGFFAKHFCEITITHEIRNIPPAYVLCCYSNGCANKSTA